jgi:hypothetical protein
MKNMYNKINYKVMKKIIKILHLAAIMLLLAGVISCGKEKPTLKSTKWKLEGIVDVQTGEFIKIVPRRSYFDSETGNLIDGEPIDCEKCYTLTFTTDKNAEGWSMLNSIYITFFESITISPTNIPFSKRPLSGGTMIGESPEPTSYTDALQNLTSYICYNQELKLFYNNNNNDNYLLYKPYEIEK